MSKPDRDIFVFPSVLCAQTHGKRVFRSAAPEFCMKNESNLALTLTFKIETKTSPGSNVTLPKKPDNAANKPESTEKAKVVRCCCWNIDQ